MGKSVRQVSITEAFRDDAAAQQFLRRVLDDGASLPPLLAPRKWVQALYLTDAGRLKLSAHDVERLLNVSPGIARAVVAQFSDMDESGSMAVIAMRMAGRLALAFLVVALSVAQPVPRHQRHSPKSAAYRMGVIARQEAPHDASAFGDTRHDLPCALG